MEFGNSLADYEIISPKGRGAYSYVYEAKCRKTGSNVALKVVDKEGATNEHFTNRLKNEIEL